MGSGGVGSTRQVKDIGDPNRNGPLGGSDSMVVTYSSCAAGEPVSRNECMMKMLHQFR